MADAQGTFGDVPGLGIRDHGTVVRHVAKQTRNRQFTAVGATVETATWDEGVNEVTITAIQEATGTAELQASIGVAFGAPSDAAAAAWLTYAESKTADSSMVAIPVGESRTFYFSGAGITRLDCKKLFGSENIGVIVEAA